MLTKISFTAAFVIAAAVSDERIVSRRERSDFQILAHFAQSAAAGATPHVGRREAKFTAEGVGEMTMAGKAQFEGKRGQIIRAISQAFKRGAQPQTHQIAMNRRAGSPPEKASQVEWRRSNGSRHVAERYAFRHSASQISLGRLNMVGVIVFRAFPASFTLRRRQPLSRIRGFQSFGDDLKRRHFNPQWIGPQWIGRRQRRFHLTVFHDPQPPRQFAMPPEYAGGAWAGDKGKRPFRMIVNGGIEFANDTIQYSWRGDENRSAITAISRVADPI